MDIAAFNDRLKAEGFDPAEERGLPAGESRAEHAHHFDVTAMVLDGDITLTCGGTRTTYTAGQVFTMAAGMPHCEDVGPAGVRYLVGRRE
jgi:uncharacterized cupin superfamily protein